MTVSNPTDSKSSITKSLLIISHYAFGMERVQLTNGQMSSKLSSYAEVIDTYILTDIS